MASQPPRLIAIAPAAPGSCNQDSSNVQPAMPYTCQTCAKRKVRCDKASPICSTCRRSKLECIYEAPRPRTRKRKLSGDVIERLARYERLLRQHGLLDSDTDQPSPAGAGAAISSEPISLLWDEPEGTGTGKVLISNGKSRYVNSKLWRTIGGDDTDNDLDKDDDGEIDDESENSGGSLDGAGPMPPAGPFPDPLTGAFLQTPQLNLLQYHPSHDEAMAMWETYVENVEPLCKLLHVPSTRCMVETVSKQPESASRSNECLLFAIYHFAVFSSTEEECVRKFGRSRDVLRPRYHGAVRQALANASFLETTDFTILQALVLLLLPSRDQYEPQTYWILTGVAIRIGRRLGVHRDGQKLGLPPFQVEMSRRLFYQLMPLDARAGQMADMGASVLPEAWDVQAPLNINDDQIWPGMAELPQAHTGATDMIFCLSRACVGEFFAKGVGAGSWTFKDSGAADQVVNQAERTVEERYIRYCDVVNPLHFLAICMARSGIAVMRLRVRLSKAMNDSATNAEAREAVQLALKILNTDAAVCSHPGLKKYRWHTASFSIWGTWDSSIVVLTTLARRSGLFSAKEADDAWAAVEALYCHHEELFQSKRALYVALGRLTLKAWEATPRSTANGGNPEPEFITTLRAINTRKRQGKDTTASDDTQENTDSGISTAFSPEICWDPGLGSSSGGFNTDFGNEIDLDATDWTFWDRLIQDHGLETSKEEENSKIRQE